MLHARNWAALALVTTSALGSAHAARTVDLTNLNEFPAQITTSIAKVVENKKEIVVYADKDVRVLTLAATDKEALATLKAVEKNGCSVKIDLDTTAGASGFAIKAVTAEPCAVTTLGKNPTMDEVAAAIKSGALPVQYSNGGQYTPLDVGTMAAAGVTFKNLYPYQANRYDVNDNCFNRAMFWARSIQVEGMFNGSGTGADKVFIFFTRAYQKRFAHKWWFHVAPVIYANGSPIVLDPTFEPSPLTLQNWLSDFDQHLGGRCKQLRTMDEFYQRSDEVACFHIRANMYSYLPSDLDGVGPNNWRCEDFRTMMSKIPAPGSHTGHANGGWNGPSNQMILPEQCGGVHPQPRN